MLVDVNSNKIQNYVTLFLIFLFGCFLRFFQLGEKSLWTDELVVIANAVNLVDIEAFFTHAQSDDLPKFYSLIFKFWLRLGDSEFAMRGLSALFGCMTILVTYSLTRLFFDTKISLTAAFLTAISPFLLIYDREIRMYSLFAMFSLISSYLFIQAFRENKKSWWILYAVINILNMYTHYYAVLILGVQWLFFLIRIRQGQVILKAWITANAAIALSFVFRMPALIQDVAYHAPWALPRERFPFIFAKNVVEFFYVFFSFSAGQTILPWNPAAILVCLAVFACVGVALRKGIDYSDDALYLILLIIVPIIVGNIFRISMPRYFLFAAPVFFILIARGLWLIPQKTNIAAAVIISLIWGYGLVNYYQNKQFHIMAHVDPWREAAHFLKEKVQKDEELVIVGIGVIPLGHYYGETLPAFSEDQVIEKAKEVDEKGIKKVWLVYTYQEEYENWRQAQRLLSTNYSVIDGEKWMHDPDSHIKKKFFRRNFSPYRIVAELYERKGL